jgi:hypothetical protein
LTAFHSVLIVAPMAPRRFPPPWTVHKVAGGYRVDDAAGQALAHVYGREAHMALQAKGLTWDEARRIAAGIARLPELMATRERATAADG